MKKTKNNRGITVIELLIASAASLLLLVAAFYSLKTNFDTAGQSAEQVNIYRNFNIIIECLKQDLRFARSMEITMRAGQLEYSFDTLRSLDDSGENEKLDKVKYIYTAGQNEDTIAVTRRNNTQIYRFPEKITFSIKTNNQSATVYLGLEKMPATFTVQMPNFVSSCVNREISGSSGTESRYSSQSYTAIPPLAGSNFWYEPGLDRVTGAERSYGELDFSGNFKIASNREDFSPDELTATAKPPDSFHPVKTGSQSSQVKENDSVPVSITAIPADICTDPGTKRIEGISKTIIDISKSIPPAGKIMIDGQLPEKTASERTNTGENIKKIEELSSDASRIFTTESIEESFRKQASNLKTPSSLNSTGKTGGIKSGIITENSHSGFNIEKELEKGSYLKNSSDKLSGQKNITKISSEEFSGVLSTSLDSPFE